MNILYIFKIINNENQLSEIGSLVKIDPQRINGKVSDELSELLSRNSVGEVIGYKITDGTDIGLILKLSNGSNAWFFKNELDLVDSVLTANNTINNSIYRTHRKLFIKKDIKYVLNPINFYNWLMASMQDVI